MAKMRHVVDLNKGVLGQGDSVDLWTEIISHIPDAVLTEPGVKILSVACGHCTEAVIIAKRMLALGVSKEDVNDSIYLIDKYSMFTNPAKVLYGFKNVITGDFLTWETDMKFKAIVGNPPFKSPDSSLNLWPLFIEKAINSLNDSGILAMVTPTTWMRPSTDIKRAKKEGGSKYVLKDFMQEYNTTAINIGTVADHFTVGSTFCWFVITKEPHQGKTVITALNGEQVIVDLRKFSVFPESAPATVISIFEKMQQHKDKFNFKGIRGAGKEDLTYNETQTQRFKYQYVGGQYSKKNLNNDLQCVMFYSSKKHPDFNKSKVVINYIGDIHPYVDNGNAGMQYCQVHFLKDASECFGAESLFKSKLFRLFFTHVRYGMHNEAGVLNALPKLDLTKKWTDKALYKHFGLTQEEIDYVESNVK